MPADLETCAHVLIRHDSYRSPLQARYDGPFLVLKRYRKYFTLQKGSKVENISVDRIKPAYFDHDPASSTTLSPLPAPAPSTSTSQDNIDFMPILPFTSTSSPPDPLPTPSSVVTPSPATSAPRATTSPPPVPVSYTHLRAHETPEHLVCRLLLEK